LAYAGAILLLWRLAGRPAGVEAALLRRLRHPAAAPGPGNAGSRRLKARLSR
jgi:hypothetical protein